jgi:serine/threonine protein kinase
MPDDLPESFDPDPFLQPDYKAIEFLGEGSLGKVWRGEGPGGVPVAIKILLNRLSDQDEARQKLHSLEVVKHPYLLQIFNYWIKRERLVIVAELADGSLRDLLRKYRGEGQEGIPSGELLEYFGQAAEAIDYLHSQNVLHRDIKPDNILLRKQHVKVADFGLAHSKHQLMGTPAYMAQTMGTPAYMAPEAWRGQNWPESDQYSLACAYAELRLGNRLFSEVSDLFTVAQAHLDKTPDLSGLARPERNALLKALSKEPSNRFSSCMQMVMKLKEAVQPRPRVWRRLWHWMGRD